MAVQVLEDSLRNVLAIKGIFIFLDADCPPQLDLLLVHLSIQSHSQAIWEKQAP